MQFTKVHFIGIAKNDLKEAIVSKTGERLAS